MLRLLHCAIGLRLVAAIPAQAVDAPAWREWRPDLFTQAEHDQRLVLLDLGAGWCHWCHVMEDTTYRDPGVLSRLATHFIAVRVDQDERPDLASRYEDYGWPATVVFDSHGRELVKLRGYIPPERMVALLQALIDDPTPGPSVSNAPAPAQAVAGSGMTAALRGELADDFRATYDAPNAGWGTVHKYLDADAIEYALRSSEQPGPADPSGEQMARATLDAGRVLLDPVWGGCYQYSAGGVWSQPHFEKIMPVQADALRAYALGYARWHRPEDAAAARAIVGYVRDFLTAPDGAFYTSQDADLHPGEHAEAYFQLADGPRRALGIPRIDQHQYARDNGLMIAALCAWSAASGDAEPLAAAVPAAQWVIANRRQANGLYSHDAHDAAGPYLSDTLAIARGCLALHQITGEQPWLDQAIAAARAIASTFAMPDGMGYRTAALTDGLAPLPQRDENLALARCTNLLAHAVADRDAAQATALRAMTQQALAVLTSPTMAHRRPTAGLLLLDRELAQPPLHIQIRGAPSDPQAMALHAAALALPDAYRLVGWIASTAAPAAVVCGASSCSPPLTTVAQLQRYVSSGR